MEKENDTTLEMHEKELFELQPFLYLGFGIQLMIEEEECGLCRRYWAVMKDKVGLPGCLTTLRLDSNSLHRCSGKSFRRLSLSQTSFVILENKFGHRRRADLGEQTVRGITLHFNNLYHMLNF